MIPAPDIPGFIAAQERLIDQLGTDVVFHISVPKVYGEDVAVDPESGEPYDPTAVAESGGGYVDVPLRVGLVRRILDAGANDEVQPEPVGVMRTDRAALAVKSADYDAVKDAVEVTVAGDRYRVTDTTGDPLASTVYRHVFYLEAK